MKLQAKDIKIGMTIRQGKWSMLVEDLKNSSQKNGTQTIIAEGIVTNARKNIYGKISASFKSERTYKQLTKLDVL